MTTTLSDGTTRTAPAIWRCPACAAQPLLGLYTSAGLHVRAGGRRQHQPTHYVVNFETGSVLAHCYACHSWRALVYDKRARRVREQRWDGPTPVVGCDCEQEGFVPKQENLDPGLAPLPAEQLQRPRIPQPEELAWIDPNSDAARCTVCNGLYGNMLEDPFTRARRHVGCAPREVVTENGEVVPSARPALVRERAAPRPEPPGSRPPQEGERSAP